MKREQILRDDVTPDPVYAWSVLRKRWRDCLRFPDIDLDVIRHGETELNEADLVTGQLDVALSFRGRSQASALGAVLRPPYAAIYASTQRRSIETLVLALQAARVDANYLTDARLNERSLGEMEGRPRMFVPQFAAGDLDFAPAGGESYRSVVQRCMSFLLDLHGESRTWDRGQRVLVCGHMGPLRVIVATVTGERVSARMMAQEWRNALKFRLHLAAVPWPRFLVRATYDDGE